MVKDGVGVHARKMLSLEPSLVSVEGNKGFS
jgi:hypothetical protein